MAYFKAKISNNVKISSTDFRTFRHEILIAKHGRACRHGILAPAQHELDLASSDSFYTDESIAASPINNSLTPPARRV